jgi:hypothetical protein
MAMNTRNPAGCVHDPTLGSGAAGVVESLRQQLAMARQHDALTSHLPHAGEPVACATKERNAMREAAAVFRSAQAADGVRAAFAGHKAKQALSAGVIPGHQAILKSFGLGTHSSIVLNSIARINRAQHVGMMAAITGGRRKTIFDGALRGATGPTAGIERVLSGRHKNFLDHALAQNAGYKAHIAAASVQASAQTDFIQGSVQHAAKLAARSRIVPTLAEYGQVNLRAVVGSGEVFNRTVRIPPINLLTLFPSEAMGRAKELFKALDRVEGAWADDALWFVFSRLTHKSMFLFDRLERREQVEAATLDALERVFREGAFIELLSKAMTLAPYISEYQRDILIHALDHVRKGDYRLAISHLLDGLEGAIVRAAMARAIIDQDRWLIGKPRHKKNRRHGVDAIVSEMSLDEQYERFLHRGVFGKKGNSARHGSVEDNERSRALLLVVAVAGWTDIFMDLRATKTLVDAMTMFLPDAVSRQRQLTS